MAAKRKVTKAPARKDVPKKQKVPAKPAAPRAKAPPAKAPRKAAPAPVRPGTKIFCVVHEVTDLEAASSAYARLLGDPGRRIPEGGGRHYFDVGGAILALLDVNGRAAQSSGSDLYLTVPGAELPRIHARAKALKWLSPAKVHGEPAGAIVVRPWGERSFYVQDPYGNGIAFIDEKTCFTGR